MSDARNQAQAALDGLVSSANLVGAGLVSRDGLPILMRFKRPVQEETFCAMSAALLGAAEAAVQEISATGQVSATIEASDLRLHVAGLDDVHLLVVAVAATSDLAKTRAAIEAARTGLRGILGG